MWSSVIACLGVVVGVVGQLPPVPQVGGEFDDKGADGSYKFGFQSGDRGNHYRTEVASKDNQVVGRFGLRDPMKNRVVETQYTAGRRGFRAKGPNIARQMDLSQVKIPYNPPVSPDSPNYKPTYGGYHDPNEDPSYKFGFRTAKHSKQETSDSLGHVEGVYSFVDDNGERHDVRYKAGSGTGFVVDTAFPDSKAFTGVFYKGPPGKPGGKLRGRSSIQQRSDGSYQFVAHAPDHRRTETSDRNGNVRGSYTYLDDKGQQRTIEYIAGPNIGYKVVKKGIGPSIPPPPSFLPPNTFFNPFSPNYEGVENSEAGGGSGRPKPGGAGGSSSDLVSGSPGTFGGGGPQGNSFGSGGSPGGSFGSSGSPGGGFGGSGNPPGGGFGGPGSPPGGGFGGPGGSPGSNFGSSGSPGGGFGGPGSPTGGGFGGPGGSPGSNFGSSGSPGGGFGGPGSPPGGGFGGPGSPPGGGFGGPGGSPGSNFGSSGSPGGGFGGSPGGSGLPGGSFSPGGGGGGGSPGGFGSGSTSFGGSPESPYGVSSSPRPPSYVSPSGPPGGTGPGSFGGKPSFPPGIDSSEGFGRPGGDGGYEVTGTTPSTGTSVNVSPVFGNDFGDGTPIPPPAPFVTTSTSTYRPPTTSTGFPGSGTDYYVPDGGKPTGPGGNKEPSFTGYPNGRPPNGISLIPGDLSNNCCRPRPSATSISLSTSTRSPPNYDDIYLQSPSFNNDSPPERPPFRPTVSPPPDYPSRPPYSEFSLTYDESNHGRTTFKERYNKDDDVYTNSDKSYFRVPGPVRAHVQSIDLLPFGSRIPNPGEALERGISHDKQS